MLEIRDLSFGYYGGVPLFNHLTLNLKPGSICGLLGKNGAGKTTLLRIIAGLIFPDEGVCQVLGESSKERKVNFLQDIYFLPEEFHLPALTAKQYINLYAFFYPKFNQADLENYLKEFDLPFNKTLTNLSHGQKKKFLIAFGLATNTKILILDEPTNGLDIPSKAQFRKLLASAITEEKLFIISTHQVHDVENIVDSVTMLDEGKIVFQQNLFDVAKYLTFFTTSTEPVPGTYYYCEKNLNGYNVVAFNQEQQETQVDLELLFNAVLADQGGLNQAFSGEKS